MSISGGGYRAAAFSVGAILAISDMERTDRVSAISSVSGGSITNAFTARRMLSNHDNLSGPDRWLRAAELIERLGHVDCLNSRKFLKRAVVLPLIVGIVGPCVIIFFIAVTGSFHLSSGWIRGAVLSYLGFMGLMTLMYLQIPVWAYLKLHTTLIPQLENMTGNTCVRPPKSERMSIFRTFYLIFTFRLGRLSDQQLVRLRPVLVPLDRVESTYVPVFCTTDLASGAHFYLSPSFVSGLAPGQLGTGPRTTVVGSPNTLSMAEAVGASAAFPGVFQPTVVQSADLGLPVRAGLMPDLLSLADGGLFDNLGTTVLQEWIGGRHPSQVVDVLGAPPKEIVVVECGRAAYSGNRFSVIRAFTRSMDVVHQANSAARREQALSMLGSSQCSGFIVSIGDDPHDFAAAMTEMNAPAERSDSPSMFDRRKKVTEFLAQFERTSRQGSEYGLAWWRAVSQQVNPAVPTNMEALGLETVIRLVIHGYMATVAKAVWILDWEPPAEAPDLIVLRDACDDAKIRREDTEKATGATRS